MTTQTPPDQSPSSSTPAEPTDPAVPETARVDGRPFNGVDLVLISLYDYLPIEIDVGWLDRVRENSYMNFHAEYFFGENLPDPLPEGVPPIPSNFSRPTRPLSELARAYVENNFSQDKVVVNSYHPRRARGGEFYPAHFGSNEIIYQPDGAHLPAHLRHIKLPRDPLAAAIYAADPSIPRPLYMEIPANRFALHNFIIEENKKIMSVPRTYRRAYQRLLHGWLTASLAKTSQGLYYNLEGEGWGILKRCIGYAANQFISQIGIISSSSYVAPTAATDDWKVAYPLNGRLVETPAWLLAGAGRAGDEDSDYTAALAMMGVTQADLIESVI